ncbi:MAG: FG-GAP repeat protein [Deltaproteobacteria bacterium]|nr:FG-GAP repeat protein [Deltaproteobacteria bacterium]
MTDANSQSATGTLNITVTTTPQVGIGGGPSTLTIGTTAAYTATPPQNFTEPFQIVWSLDGAPISQAQDLLTAQVTAETEGTHVLSVTMTDANSQSATGTLNITITLKLKITHDFNGDGIADILVGAEDNGTAYIFYGSTSLSASIDASTANVKFIGGSRFGASVSGAGDVNKDGIDDVIVGARTSDVDGGVYIFYGGTSLAPSINASAANVKLIGEVSGGSNQGQFGFSVSGAGDVNNDGFADVIVGDPYQSAGGDAAGTAYIFYGGISLAPSINASAANVKFIGPSSSARLGFSVSGAGDVNKDGFADVIVGSEWGAYIFYGGTSLVSSNASAANVKLMGEVVTDSFGSPVSGAGDVNKDGFSDVIVGAAEAAYIFLGSTSLASSINASAANVKLIGQGGRFGISVSGVGDVNKDGFADVIVGANLDGTAGPSAGAAYIFYGATSLASLANAKLIGQSARDEFGTSVSGAGDVNNDGFADVIVGAPLADDARKGGAGGEAGAAYIFYGAASQASSINASSANVKFIGENGLDALGASVSGGSH